MAVTIGSARIDERGKTYGGQAGDQTGKEVSTQSWYLHSKGWRDIRAINADVAKKIAEFVKWACSCSLIGYDQYERNTLYKELERIGFGNYKKLSKKVETDCSALVRCAVKYATGIDLPAEFRTVNMCSYLLKTGAFMEMKDTKYTTKADYLKVGDILCTKSSGHTVVVLTDGSKSASDTSKQQTVKMYSLGERELKHGSEGADVKTLQEYLIKLGFSCGSYGADGEFGDATEIAVENFQRADGHLEVDGVVGPKTLEALLTAIEKETPAGRKVLIFGGNCYARSAPGTSSAKLGVCHDGEKYAYQGEQHDGWNLIEYRGENAWVSGKYSKVVDK